MYSAESIGSDAKDPNISGDRFDIPIRGSNLRIGRLYFMICALGTTRCHNMAKKLLTSIFPNIQQNGFPVYIFGLKGSFPYSIGRNVQLIGQLERGE